MSTALANVSWQACLSSLRLDRWLAGELSSAEAEEVRAHVGSCVRCSGAAASMREAREAEPLPPLRLAAPPRPAHRPRLALGGAGLALAAGLLFLLLPEGPAERTKGGGAALGMWVRHGEEVRRAAPGEAVAPGDAIRFVVTTPRRAFVAILSLDPAGRGSVYFPGGERAAEVAAGVDVPLPLATRLDETPGEERILGLFCDRPVLLEPLRSALERDGALGNPGGCEVIEWRFAKR